MLNNIDNIINKMIEIVFGEFNAEETEKDPGYLFLI